jgi:hypothetical protein
MAVRLSALRACCALPQKDLLELISVRGRVIARELKRLERLGALKILCDHIGTRSSTLKVHNFAAQPCKPPRASSSHYSPQYKKLYQLC